MTTAYNYCYCYSFADSFRVYLNNQYTIHFGISSVALCGTSMHQPSLKMHCKFRMQAVGSPCNHAINCILTSASFRCPPSIPDCNLQFLLSFSPLYEPSWAKTFHSDLHQTRRPHRRPPRPCRRHQRLSTPYSLRRSAPGCPYPCYHGDHRRLHARLAL